MKKKLILILFFVFSCGAKEKKLLVGESVKLKFHVNNISEIQVREQLKEFEITKFEKTGGSYKVILSCFVPGRFVLDLGNKKEILVVESSLKNMDNAAIDNYFEIYEKPQVKRVKAFPYTFTFILIGMFFILYMGRFIVANLVAKFVKITPYEVLLKHIEELSVSDITSKRKIFFIMTSLLKRYIENRFAVQISGKTSSEIIRSIEDSVELEEMKPYSGNLKDWLYSLDYYKYSNAEFDLQQVLGSLERLKEIVAEIENRLIEKEKIAKNRN